MRTRLILLLLLCAMGASAQVPAVSTSSNLKFFEGNNSFIRSVSDLFAAPTFSGDVSGSYNNLQLGSNVVADADLRQSAGLSVIGRSANTTGNVADITAGSDFQVLRRSGSSIAFGSINLASTSAVTGTLPGGNGGTGTTSFGGTGRIPYASSTTVLTNAANFNYTSSVLRVLNTSTTQAFFNTADQENIRIGNTDATSGNWSSIASYTSGNVVDATLSVQHINHTSRESAMNIHCYGGGSYQRLAVFHYNGDTLFKAATFMSTMKVVSTSTFTGAATFNGGITVNTVAPTINTDLQIGSSSVGSQLRVYNDYSSTSPAGSSAFANIILRNRNSTTNNWMAFQFDANNAIAADMSAQVTNHTSSYADVVFHTRGATGGYGEVMRITADKYVGIAQSIPTARLDVKGIGATSGTSGLIVENSSGTAALTVRDDGVSAFGGSPATSVRLTVAATTADSTTYAFDAKRSSTSVLKVRADGKVTINNASFQDELTINGHMRSDGLVLTHQSASTSSGKVRYNNGGSYAGFLQLGDGDNATIIAPKTIQLQAIDYNVAWTTGRTKAFWTVPARYNGYMVSKCYLVVSTIGSGSNTVDIEKGGSALASQTISSSDHTVTLNNTLSTGDIFTFNVTSVGGTASKGLFVELELATN